MEVRFAAFLSDSIPPEDYYLYRQKTKRFFKAFETLPLSSCFSLDNPEAMENYDVVVVGSDEVWNLFHPWYGAHPLFFGDRIKSERLISYAATFGNYPASAGLPQEWTDELLNFDWLSVRDDNSRRIVENATGLEPQLVLDPALQFSVKPEERDACTGKNHM